MEDGTERDVGEIEEEEEEAVSSAHSTGGSVAELIYDDSYLPYSPPYQGGKAKSFPSKVTVVGSDFPLWLWLALRTASLRPRG